IAAGTTLTALWTEAPDLLRKGFLGMGALCVAAAALVAALPASIWTGAAVSRIAPHLGLMALGSAAGVMSIAALTWWKGPKAAFVGTAVFIAVAFFGYGFFVNPWLNPENREAAEFCRRVATK